MEALDALTAANTEFESRLREVGSEHWTLSTPCPDWDVRALVNHVLLGTRMSVHVLAGMPREEVIAGLDDDLISDGKDPITDFVDLADQMVEGFSGPNGLEGTVAHPAGDFPRSMFIGFRVADGAVHAWDLATAINAHTALDAELVRFLWDDAQPQREMLMASGMFGDGPSGSVSDDAPLQTRYLDLVGRRP
ncbi:MAG: TIGR03086 family metal-binding protein [Acidimicrobiia bacterium]|nr:TIGR03086 family metal-binding protein [Acidimicrobiia bacterium]